MSKEGLEALERLGKFRNEDGMFAFQSKDYFFIEKELKEKEEILDALSKMSYQCGNLLRYKKALEIIKNLNLNVVYYGFIDGKDVYALRLGELDIKYISQEEHDSLKEVLLWVKN